MARFMRAIHVFPTPPFVIAGLDPAIQKPRSRGVSLRKESLDAANHAERKNPLERNGLIENRELKLAFEFLDISPTLVVQWIFTAHDQPARFVRTRPV